MCQIYPIKYPKRVITSYSIHYTKLYEANIVTSIIPITIIDNHPHPEVTPPPTPPGPPILPITRPDHEEMGGITLEAVRLPGPVGITIGGPDTRAGIPAGGEKCFEFCSLEDVITSYSIHYTKLYDRTAPYQGPEH